MRDMRTKRQIENQLQHFRNDCPAADSGENKIWIKALEWVLGDEEHQKTYAAFISSLEKLGELPSDIEHTLRERSISLALNQALWFLK
jgi:acyl-CoA thioesterase